MANVAGKLKEEHPTWKLPERRVKKFVKKYISEKEANPPATDDEDASADKKPSLKKFSSPSRSIRRLFSPKKKKDAPVAVDPDTSSDAPPVSGEDSASELVIAKEEDSVEEEEPDTVEEENVVEEEKEDAYATEENAESSYDCFAPCAIM